jgi:protein transport protein SEC61 subunit alpha
MPIILQTALVSNFKFFSEILAKRFSTNIVVNLLGREEADSLAKKLDIVSVPLV